MESSNIIGHQEGGDHDPWAIFTAQLPLFDNVNSKLRATFDLMRVFALTSPTFMTWWATLPLKLITSSPECVKFFLALMHTVADILTTPSQELVDALVECARLSIAGNKAAARTLYASAIQHIPDESFNMMVEQFSELNDDVTLARIMEIIHSTFPNFKSSCDGFVIERSSRV